MSDAAVESAVKDIKPKAGSDHVTAEVITAAMQGNQIDTRAARQRLTSALEANGTLPSLVLDDFNHHNTNGVVTVDQLRERAAGDPNSGETLTAQALLDRIKEIDGDHNGKIDEKEMNDWVQAQSKLDHRPDGTTVKRDASGNPVEVSAPNGDRTKYTYTADSIDITRTNENDPGHNETLHFDKKTNQWTRKDSQGTHSIANVVQTQDGYNYNDENGQHFQNNNGDHTLRKQDGTVVITQKNAAGSVDYTYPPKDSNQPVTVTWREPSGKVREELHQDRTGPTAGQWFRTYTTTDGKVVTDSVTNVAQTADGYTYTDSTGNRIDQNKNGERQLSKTNGDYVIFDASGQPAQVFQQSNGNHETLFKKSDGSWWRQSGRAGEAHSLEPISSVVVDTKDGSYSFKSRGGTRATEQRANGERVDEDSSKGTPTRYTWKADGNLKQVESVNPDGSRETLTPEGDHWTLSRNGGAPEPVRAEVDPLNGRYQYQKPDGSGAIRNADGSRVEVAVVTVGDKKVVKPVAVSRPDGLAYAIAYDEKGNIANVEVRIPGKPGDAANDFSPERVDKWLPTDKPGEMRRSDGVVATDLTYDAAGNFSFVYVNHLGIKVKHTDKANGTQSDEAV